MQGRTSRPERSGRPAPTRFDLGTGAGAADSARMPVAAPFPKIELHVHLEGTVRPPALLEIARRNGVDLGVTDEAAWRLVAHDRLREGHRRYRRHRADWAGPATGT